MEPRTLTRDEADAFGRELDALKNEVVADLGQRDTDHIRRVIGAQRLAEAVGRVLLHVGIDPLTFAAGTGALALAKILENMEIGHNVMHGQWDWMNDPNIHSSTWDWDTASPAAAWKHSHNYIHHTYTNVIGKDKDVGYEVFRVDPR
ncbi:MAG TPA: acyl-CoA desaturase, partial [Polyangia bacterium]